MNPLTEGAGSPGRRVTATSDPPDVLLVIGDCVGISQDMGRLPGNNRLRNITQLESHSVTFQNAVSPSYWSLPAHASILTGCHPWEHGVIRDGLSLADTHRTIAQEAREAGYRTAAFSSNPYLSHASGLSRGFEVCRHGDFSEMYFKGITFHPSEGGGGPGISSLPIQLSPAKRMAQNFIRQHPWAVDLAVDFGARFRGGELESIGWVSPWIEPSLFRWLSQIDAATPVFCLVNYMDAHEPYVGLSARLKSGRTRREVWNALRVPWLSSIGRFEGPADHGLTVLRELYLASLEVLDDRLGQLIDCFMRVRGGRRPLIVFVGDHGQAFGGGANLLHSYGLSDDVFRVPLVISSPSGSESGLRVNRWTSTREVCGVIREFITGRVQTASSLYRAGPDESPKDCAWALTEVPTPGVPFGIEPGQHHGTGMRLVCYSGESRRVYRSTGSGVELDTGNDDRWPLYHSTPAMASGEASEVEEIETARRAFTALNHLTRGQSPEQRLSSWGYV